MYSLDQLHSLWGDITDQTATRIGYIKTLDAQLSSIEEDRIKLVSLSECVVSIFDHDDIISWCRISHDTH